MLEILHRSTFPARAPRRFPGIRPREILFPVAVVLVASLLAGCGYSLVGRATNIPEDIEAVFVEPLENKTPRQQVEQILTQAILDELVTRRAFEIVNSEAEADAVLRGSADAVTVRPVSFDQQGLATDFEISIRADMRFERVLAPGQLEPEVIWKSAHYLFRQDYSVESGSIEDAFQERENEAIEETAESFARTFVTDLLSGF